MTQKPVPDYESKPGYARPKSPDEPVLDYQPKPATPVWRQRLGAYALAASCVLAAMPLVLSLARMLLRTNLGHGISINRWLAIGLVCNLVGMACAGMAMRWGRRKAGWALLVVNTLSFLLTAALPTFR
jgi:hypothetical protein